MGSPLILIADDSASVRAVVRVALRSTGLEVEEVEDGRQALDAMFSRRPDVVLLDVEMPVLDGFRVLEQMRRSPTLRTIPVILLTAQGGSDALVAGLDRGAHDYLTKPFEPAELAARVGAALRTAQLLGRLDRRNQELDHFAAKAAHDLKSPLTVIKGGAEVLRMGWHRLPESTRNDQLAAMSRAAHRAATMIDDLLALARLDEVEGGDPGETDARAVLQAVVADARLEQRELVRLEGEFIPVAVPSADLKAAVANLLDNARHYGRCADGTLEVSILGRPEPERLVIDITDQGTGIPEEARGRVFDPFYRVPGSTDVNPSSTGVGLAIVRRAIERWGGRVELAEGEQRGTTFRLALPVPAGPG